MSLRLTKRRKIIVSSLLHPHFRETIKTYMEPHDIKIIEIPFHEGTTDIEKIKQAVDENTSAVLIQSPNFFGSIENIAEISELAHQKKAMSFRLLPKVCLWLF